MVVRNLHNEDAEELDLSQIAKTLMSLISYSLWLQHFMMETSLFYIVLMIDTFHN